MCCSGCWRLASLPHSSFFFLPSQKHWMRKIKQRWVKSRRRWSRRYNGESIRLLTKGRWGTSERLHSRLTFPTAALSSLPSPTSATRHLENWAYSGIMWAISRVRELIHCQPLIPCLTSPPQYPCLFLNASRSSDAFRVWGEMTSLMVYRPRTRENKRPRA